MEIFYNFLETTDKFCLTLLTLLEQIQDGYLPVLLMQFIQVFLANLPIFLVIPEHLNILDEPLILIDLLPIERDTAPDLHIRKRITLIHDDLFSLHKVGHLRPPINPPRQIPRARHPRGPPGNQHHGEFLPLHINLKLPHKPLNHRYEPPRLTVS